MQFIRIIKTSLNTNPTLIYGFKTASSNPASFQGILSELLASAEDLQRKGILYSEGDCFMGSKTLVKSVMIENAHFMYSSTSNRNLRVSRKILKLMQCLPETFKLLCPQVRYTLSFTESLFIITLDTCSLCLSNSITEKRRLLCLDLTQIACKYLILSKAFLNYSGNEGIVYDFDYSSE